MYELLECTNCGYTLEEYEEGTYDTCPECGGNLVSVIIEESDEEDE